MNPFLDGFTLRFPARDNLPFADEAAQDIIGSHTWFRFRDGSLEDTHLLEVVDARVVADGKAIELVLRQPRLEEQSSTERTLVDALDDERRRIANLERLVRTWVDRIDSVLEADLPPGSSGRLMTLLRDLKRSAESELVDEGYR